MAQGLKTSRRPMSEGTKRKISEARKGMIFSAEHKAKLSESHKGKAWSDDAKKKMSDLMKKRIFSEEHRRNLSAGLKKRWEKGCSDETRKRMSVSHIGKVYGENYKRNMSRIKAIEVKNGVGRKKEFEYNGFLFRSANEVNMARWLDAQQVKWDYEPEVFELPNGRHYVPDFKVGDEWIEVKNRFSARDLIKLNYFAKSHVLRVADASKPIPEIEVWNG